MDDNRTLSGTCAFRLMPTDELADAPSSATLNRIGAQGFTLAYSWVHAADGAQRGTILVGGTGPEGEVEASWFDTWHQQPGLMHFTGERAGDRLDLRGTYLGEWGWTVSLDLAGDTVAMTMCNVVPESALADLPPDAPAMSAGPYDVMVARWA